MKAAKTTGIKKMFLFITLAFLAITAKAQLTGTVTLSGQTTHSGTKIKFTAASPTASADSCLTGANGSFAITISPGLYRIRYTHAGYQDYLYNSDQTVVVTNTTVLPAVTLTAGATMYVGGSVSGSWLSNTLYYVVGDLNVPSGSTLTIQAGTIVKFVAYHIFTVNGVIKALGNSNQRIVFTSNSPTHTRSEWDGFGIKSSGSVFDFCIVQDCPVAFTAVNHADLTVSNSILRHLNVGAISSTGNLDVRANEIGDYRTFGIACGGGSGNISCNNMYGDTTFSYISGGSSDPKHILTGGQYIIENNNIHHGTYGIMMEGGSGNFVKNNYLHHNTYAVENDGTPASTCTITNNTIVYNGIGGLMGGANQLRFSNNIVANNMTGISTDANPLCDYNLFYNNSTANGSTQITGFGQLITTNANGSPVDAYYNVFADPGFDPVLSAPYLLPNSVTFNVGNPAYKNNIGANATAVCYSNLTTGILSYKKEERNFNFFPNPTTGSLNLELTAKSSVVIYDVLGKAVFAAELTDGKHQLDLSDQTSGVYFMTVKENNSTTTVKLIKE